MITNKALIFSFILVNIICISSCNSSIKDESHDFNRDDGENKFETIIKSAEIQKSEIPKHDIKSIEIYSFLVDKKIIPLDFPLELVFNEVIVEKTKSFILGYYQLGYHSSMLSYSDDPMFNVLFLIENDKLVLCKVLSSVDLDDFSFEFSKMDLYYFIDYSSPAGLSRFLIIDARKGYLYITERMNEDEFNDIDETSFDFKNFKYLLKSGIEKKIKLNKETNFILR